MVNELLAIQILQSWWCTKHWLYVKHIKPPEQACRITIFGFPFIAEKFCGERSLYMSTSLIFLYDPLSLANTVP